MDFSVLKRIALSMLLGFALATAFTELSYRVLKRENRPPRRVQLVIPVGTAEKIAQGEAPPTIPTDMTFVVGDTLVVVNQDDTDHELGPLWIPPGTSASLNLDTEQNFILSCSFQPTSVFGIDVRQPVTPGVRAMGILFGGLPLGVLLSVYSTLLAKENKKVLQA
jgi:hypothetical protein